MATIGELCGFHKSSASISDVAKAVKAVRAARAAKAIATANKVKVPGVVPPLSRKFVAPQPKPWAKKGPLKEFPELKPGEMWDTSRLGSSNPHYRPSIQTKFHSDDSWVNKAISDFGVGSGLFD